MSEKLNYYQLGNGPNDILLIHGLAADSGFWLPLVNYIDKTKYTVNLIDLKGHGKSSFNDVAFLPSVLSLEVVELIETREYSNLILVGHSFGGRVVLNMLPNMAKHDPSKIIVLDTYWPEFQVRPSIKSVVNRSIDNDKGKPFENDENSISATQALQLMKKKNVGKANKIKKSKRTRNLSIWENIINDKDTCRLLDKQIDELIDTEILEKYHNKIDLIYGGDSLFLNSGEVASKKLKIDLTIIPKARHFFPRDQAKTTADILNAFR